MISKNMHLNEPFVLRPIGKDYLWGGSRLNDDYSKLLPLSPLAETWECSTHPDGLSFVGSGIYSGMTLKQVLKEHPEYLGIHPLKEKDFPILIKLIDAKKDLSIQVHPNDNYAAKNEEDQAGKNEMWYVLDAEPGATLVYGLRQSVKENELRKSITAGTIEKYLQKIPVKKNDVFFIEAGIIHAIGAGVLIAEIQENSNLTYRLYDYDRIDKDGKKRKLHIDKALSVADLSGNNKPRQPLRVLKYRPGCATELLCRCEKFEVYRMLINTERCRELVDYQADSISFRVLVCIDGCGSMRWGKNYGINLFKGDTVFIPANSVNVKIHGKAQFLDVRA